MFAFTRIYNAQLSIFSLAMCIMNNENIYNMKEFCKTKTTVLFFHAQSVYLHASMLKVSTTSNYTFTLLDGIVAIIVKVVLLV